MRTYKGKGKRSPPRARWRNTMNHQTRRDLAYKRNMQEWLDLYVVIERMIAAVDARYAHVDSETHPDFAAAMNAHDALAAEHRKYHAQCGRELGPDMRQHVREEARQLIAIQDQKEIPAMTPEELDAAEDFYADTPCACGHCAECDDHQAYADAQGNDDWTHNPVLADLPFVAVDEEKVKDMLTIRKHMRSILAGTAALMLALPLSVSAHTGDRMFTDYPLIGTEAYDAGCTIVREFEDHSAIAYCPEDGETWVYDADGQSVPGVANNPVREPGWYVAPELLQIGPNAPVDAR